MGPVEVVVIGFPGSQFNGEVLPALADVVERGVISLVDGMLIQRLDDGSLVVLEFDESGTSPEVDALAALIHTAVDLVSADDVEEFAAGLEPGDSAAVLVIEHTWARPFREAVLASGGRLVADLHVPGLVVDEVLAAVESAASIESEGTN